MVLTKKQEVLRDVSATGRVNPWRKKKMANTMLALAYDEVNPLKAERLRDCATFLIFKEHYTGAKTLETINSCRVRLCPICAWRRSLKIFNHTRAIVDAMHEERKYGYIFVTLTIRNCRGEELQDALDQMMAAWNRMAGYKRFKGAVKGWYRGLEVTHNVDPDSQSYDTYHPHLHCLFAVDPLYFKDKRYMQQTEWTSLWQKAMRLNYDPIVDVRKVKGNTMKAVAEAAKYAVKDSDYILPSDWDLTIDSVRLLDSALDNRRLVAYGGKMKEWHRQLNLDDEVDGDLVHVEGTLQDHEEMAALSYYVWHTGYRQYIRVESLV